MTTLATTITPAAGWRVHDASAPRGLAGANGMRLGPDGALYVASAMGSEVARVDPDTRELRIVSPRGDGIVSPDDLAFGPDGVLYVAECMDARVTAFSGGTTRVLADGLPGANGIDVFGGRVFVDQFLLEGRLWELPLDGGAPHLLAEGLAGPNGLCGSPDGFVYIAQPFTGAVVRVPMEGGPAEEVATGLAAPSSVRLGPGGMLYVSLGGDGRVLTLDPATRAITPIAQARPGIDNLAVDADGRVFISYYIDGAVYEITGPTTTRELVAPGLIGPYGVAVTATGAHLADGLAAARRTPDGALVPGGKFTDEGFPGYLRGLSRTAGGTELLVTTSEGRVARYDPDRVTSTLLADALAEPMGIAAAPDGAAIVAEAGTGRVLRIDAGTTTVVAEGLARPTGVAVAPDGAVLVADETRGTVERCEPGGRRTLIDGLRGPQDLTLSGGRLFVLEAGAGRVLALPADGGPATAVAAGLPVGSGDAGRPVLHGLPDMIPGPLSAFAGLDAGPDGRLYVGGDANGTVVVLEPTGA